MDVILTSLPAMSFNDALNCYEKLNEIDKTVDPFKFWKYCTWSIISATMSMESYLIDYIRCQCKARSITYDPKLDFPRKIKFLKDDLSCDITIYESDDFQKIRDARDLRNDIIHFRKEGIYNDITEENAKATIDACRELITFILKGHQKDPQVEASWVFEIKSRIIK